MSIELIISFVSIGISILALAITLYGSRKKLDVLISKISYDVIAPDKTFMKVSVIFENKSTNPISISTVAFRQNSEGIVFRTDAQVIMEFLKNHEKEGEIVSCQFPINLSGLGSEHAYIISSFPPSCLPDLSKPVDVVMRTNRGVITKTVEGLNHYLVSTKDFLHLRSR